MTSAGSAPEIEIALAAPEPGPRVLAPFGRRRCRVEANEAVGAYRLVGVEDRDGPAPLPGQFYMLSAVAGWGGEGGQRPYLGRAFSVCRVQGERMEFLVDEIGPGTRRLAALHPGEELWLVGPLGIGFQRPEPTSAGGEPAAVIVGGGIGIAPLVFLSEALAGYGTTVDVLLGFRSALYGDAANLFETDVVLATDDGSAGHHGLVTELLETKLDAAADCIVFACGPPTMLEAVRSICATRSVRAQLAMEEAMACGFGACFGCVVRTRSGYRRLCVDGPVIAGDDLDDTWLRG
jgi:dihydroorotate dehydrogenase electron transfer subunit